MSSLFFRRLNVRTKSHLTSKSISSNPNLNTHVEVERKFTPPSDFLFEITQLAGPLFLHREARTILHDIYYDHENQLLNRGIYIRRRETLTFPLTSGTTTSPLNTTTSWEAKKRLSGTYTNSTFTELHTLPAIQALLHTHLPNQPLSTLSILADLKTTRQTWTLSNAIDSRSIGGTPPSIDLKQPSPRLSIVHDTVTSPSNQTDMPPFAHTIGEVELVLDNEASHDQETTSAALHAHLETFMAQHPSLFPPYSTKKEEPKGKLTAYFEWKQAQSADKE